MPLFAGSEHSSMGAAYVIMSGAKLGGCTNTYIDYLFWSLSSTILPQPNTLPETGHEASKYLKHLGHSYKSYDAWPNMCTLFCGNLQDACVCPKCRVPRRKRVGSSMFPQKVCSRFAIIQRLKRMFRSPVQAAQTTWWAAN